MPSLEIDLPYSMSLFDHKNKSAAYDCNAAELRSSVKRETRSGGSKLSKSSKSLMKPPHKKRMPLDELDTMESLSTMCNGNIFYCSKKKVQICHYSFAERTFHETCVSVSKAKEFLMTKIGDYCGRCHSTCDDRNQCTVDKWDSGHRKCVYTPKKCPGGGRCDPERGCIQNIDLCGNAPNIYRTCYERPVSQRNNEYGNEFQLSSPFKNPYIGSDEVMISGDLHLVITQYGNRTNISCNDKLGLEELSLKYLKVSAE